MHECVVYRSSYFNNDFKDVLELCWSDNKCNFARSITHLENYNGSSRPSKMFPIQNTTLENLGVNIDVISDVSVRWSSVLRVVLVHRS